LYVIYAKIKPYNIKMAIDKNTPQLSSSEKAAAKKKKAIENKQKANPTLSAANKAASDAKRARRLESGSKKVINR
jgi:hypothetical protein